MERNMAEPDRLQMAIRYSAEIWQCRTGYRWQYDTAQKYGRAGQATDGNTIQRRNMAEPDRLQMAIRYSAEKMQDYINTYLKFFAFLQQQ
jgi:hypothetical protein